MINQLKTLAVSAGVLCLSVRLTAQPTACTEDSQCSSGFYCEEGAHFCRECLRCDELKRESPPSDACVKSVIDCGVCLKGLVEDLRLDRACVLPNERSDTSGVLPAYAWAFIALLLVGFCAIVIYVVCKKDTLFSYIFKIRTSTSVHNRCAGAASEATPTAPEPPPPYNTLYTRPESPDPPPAHAPPFNNLHADEDSSRPFIKRTPSARNQGQRESAGSQAARPFNNPAYIRGPASSFSQNEEIETSSPFSPHDEETMESPWTPNEITNNYTVSESATDGAVAVTGERRPAAPAASGPPAKTLCVREQDSNNNPPTGGSGPGVAAPPAGAFVINVVTNINNLEQRNNVNLPRH